MYDNAACNSHEQGGHSIQEIMNHFLCHGGGYESWKRGLNRAMWDEGRDNSAARQGTPPSNAITLLSISCSCRTDRPSITPLTPNASVNYSRRRSLVTSQHRGATFVKQRPNTLRQFYQKKSILLIDSEVQLVPCKVQRSSREEVHAASQIN
jgi:hypothetical protein